MKNTRNKYDTLHSDVQRKTAEIKEDIDSAEMMAETYIGHQLTDRDTLNKTPDMGNGNSAYVSNNELSYLANEDTSQAGSPMKQLIEQKYSTTQNKSNKVEIQPIYAQRDRTDSNASNNENRASFKKQFYFVPKGKVINLEEKEMSKHSSIASGKGSVAESA